MRAELAIAIGGGAALVGLLWWRKRQAAKAAANSPSACEQACGAAAGVAGVPGDSSGACKVACEAAGGVWDAVSGLWNSVYGPSIDELTAQYRAEQAAADKKNRELNGEPEISQDMGGHLAQGDSFTSGLGGSVLKFKNGCWPFEGSYGWQFCKPGTVDMWNGGFRPEGRERGPVSVKAARIRYYDPANPHDQDWPVGRKNIYEATGVGSGSLDPNDPDPATTGPELTASTITEIVNGERRPTGGTLAWYVSGVRVECPYNQAPARVDAKHVAWPPGRCEDPAIWGEVAPTSVDNTQGTGQREGSTSAGSCTPPVAGMTWDPSNGGYWRRALAGEALQLPPGCAGGGTQIVGLFGGASSSSSRAAVSSTGAGRLGVIHR